MKRLLFLMLAFLPVLVSAKSPKNMKLVMVKPIYNGQCTYNDWGAVISFEWSEYKNYGVTVNIKNETDSRIYVEWENARIDDEPICFSTDNSFTYQNQKPDEVVHSGSECKRFIAKRSEFEIEGRDFFHMSILKEYGSSEEVDFIIPVRFKDKTEDYKFSLKVVADKE